MSEATRAPSGGSTSIFAMFDALETVTHRPGQLVNGVLGSTEGDWITVDLDGATGRLPVGEVEAPVPGTSLELFIDEVNDEGITLSRHKASRLKLWNWLEAKRSSGGAVSATVVAEGRGEVFVEVFGVKAILPLREIASERSRDYAELAGKTFDVAITKIREKKSQIMVSERALSEGSPAERRQAFLESLTEGQVVEGEVQRFANFGAFVDLGGVDGLLHVKDIQWKRIAHPSEALELGQYLELKVLNFDRATEKIALGLKQMIPDPWTTAAERYVPGTEVSGEVVGLTQFGAFLMMDDGIEGLVHVSEMSWTEKIETPSAAVTKGKVCSAWVLRCETDRRRLGLTLKDPAENPWRKVADEQPVGSVIKTTITSVAEFGIFVALSHGLEGLVHTSDFSWAPLEGAPSEHYTAGDEIEVMMLDIDVERGRANLGIKQLSEDLTSELLNKYTVGQELNVKVTSILSYGVFAQLEPGLEGLIHVSALGQDVEDPSDLVQTGQLIRTEIIQLDTEDNRVSLRLVNLQPKPEEEQAGSPTSAEGESENEREGQSEDSMASEGASSKADAPAGESADDDQTDASSDGADRSSQPHTANEGEVSPEELSHGEKPAASTEQQPALEASEQPLEEGSAEAAEESIEPASDPEKSEQ